MPKYVLDLLDAAGRIERCVELGCIHDGEVLLRSAALGHPHAIIVRRELRRTGDVRDGLIIPRILIAD